VTSFASIEVVSKLSFIHNHSLAFFSFSLSHIHQKMEQSFLSQQENADIRLAIANSKDIL
jgi:hypothetical protein